MAPKSLTGAQKAAILLLQLGMERSALVLRSLRESEIAEIMAEVARLRNVDAKMAEEVLERLTAQMIDMPFEFLRKADPRQVLSFLQDEHPGTISLVLAYMPPDSA